MLLRDLGGALAPAAGNRAGPCDLRCPAAWSGLRSGLHHARAAGGCCPCGAVCAAASLISRIRPQGTYEPLNIGEPHGFLDPGDTKGPSHRRNPRNPEPQEAPGARRRSPCSTTW
jgi:hypothetical protein